MDKLKNIEEALGIQFEKHDYGKEQTNTYQYFEHYKRITSLTLQNISIDNLDLFLHLVKEVSRLTFINCTIKDISDLIKFEILRELTLDKVTIENIDELYSDKVCTTTYDGNLKHINLKNMTIDHLAVLQPMAKKIDHIFITDCIVHNFYEVNLFTKLYDLRLNGVTIKQSDNDIVHKAKPDRNFIRILLSNMTFDVIDLFLPISENIKHIGLNSCTINSIKNLHQFSKLERLDMDTSTSIKDQQLSQDTSSTFTINYCSLGEERSYPKAKVNLQNLASIAHYIKSLEFNQYVPNDMTFLQHFTQLEKLEFEYSTVTISNFIPIAPQIKELYFSQSELKESARLKAFTQLEKITFYTNPHEKGLIDLKKLLPLKHQLKKLKVDEDEVKNVSCIKEFTVLESLDLTVTSIAETKSILAFNTLKRLRLFIDIEPEPEDTIAIDVSTITNIETLELWCYFSIEFIGIEHLQKLKNLTLYGNLKNTRLETLHNLKYLRLDEDTDINEIHSIKSLKTLVLEVSEESKIDTLEQFPNLENLNITGTANIDIGKLNKLKILRIQGESNLTNTTCFDNVPNLEKLDLGYCNIAEVKNLEKLTNLKVLDLSENGTIENIDGLKNLKKLEQLNLYSNKISDISVLNTLPNLKEVNLAGNGLEKKEYLSQLKKPEIAIFYGLPFVPFRIWDDQYFKL
ncbi:leucine-rich repeat domain-containing protein [Aquimarina sp. 2201CG1-2-11]|uniref:leucine-rich repeat domain-containing protein n=1 Tax=Aquimarina discodermiae TaxID=3231043 RepID=UPI0034632FFB